MSAIKPSLLLAALFSSATPLPGLTPEHPCIPANAAAFQPPANDHDWRGAWQTNWGELTICAFGDRFEGDYGDGHTIAGEFDPAKPHLLTGRWTHDGDALTGRLTLAMTAPGTFIGAWSLGDNDPSIKPTGLWNGQLAMLAQTANKISDELTIDLKEQPAELKGEAIGKAKRSEDGRLNQTFKLTNVTKKPVYVFGHSKDSPFFTPATRNPDTGEWEEHFIGFCGTGARLHAIAPGESISMTASIDQKFAAREIAIHLTLFDNPASEGHRQCRVTGLKAQL